jgi:hypothetical protein
MIWYTESDTKPVANKMLDMSNLRFITLLLLTLTIQAEVTFERLPEGAAQPHVAIAPDGRVHLIYFKGDGMGGDIFYTSRAANERKFSPALRVNTTPKSAIAAGTMRGPQMALGRSGRVHVCWMGGNGAEKVEVGGTRMTPMLYARLNDAGTAFEAERNLITHAGGLDGGGSVAADQRGNVYVLWHGHPPGVEGEENRALYVAHSKDDGKVFASEHRAQTQRVGACACCGLKAFAHTDGKLHVLFRVAEEGLNRNELWLCSSDFGRSFEVLNDDPWKIATCPASSASFRQVENSIVGAWETDNGVRAGILRDGAVRVVKAPGSSGKQKHPQATLNSKNELLMTWVEGAGWGTEGKLAWQLFRDGQPIGEKGMKPGIPVWSFAACYTTPKGDFVVMY